VNLYVMGDVHGQMRKLSALLRDASLIDEGYDWIGGRARLWFLGDFFDRGPDGLEVVNLVMHLQSQAPEIGGEVGAVLGNHDLFLLSAQRFLHVDAARRGFLENWLANGGEADDLRGLTEEHLRWLVTLPSLARASTTLLAHADSDFYLEYGSTIAEINASIEEVLRSRDRGSWTRLLSNFSRRHDFDDTRPGGRTTAERFLRQLGAARLIHGHTPIDKVTGNDPRKVHTAHVYAGGLCVNVDGGMYRGGPGFLYRTTV
jgi:hypothetical protein